MLVFRGLDELGESVFLFFNNLRVAHQFIKPGPASLRHNSPDHARVLTRSGVFSTRNQPPKPGRPPYPLPSRTGSVQRLTVGLSPIGRASD